MRRQDYTVGWICAVQTEYVAACELLDEEHPSLPTSSVHDDNAYTLGRIGDHYIVIACLPKGRYGIASAASVAKDMLRSFESIRIGLMVGIGGGAPSDKHDVRLGDVVVGCPVKKEGGVVPYNFGKAIQDQEFERTGSLNSPPTVLLAALNKLSGHHERKGSRIAESVQMMITQNPRLRGKYQYPGAEYDKLYDSSYTHRGGHHRCDIGCDSASPPVLLRPRRELDPDEPVVHYGLIASADQLMKDAIARDRLTKEHDVLCFEMEAAGLMNDFPCVVIRGICDYSDSHTNNMWQGYAAVTAASYAKELLGMIPEHEIARTQKAIAEIVKPLFSVPYERDVNFIDRKGIFLQIKEQLHMHHRASLCGIGGVGKSQIAIEYAYRFQQSHPQSHVFWIYAANSTQFVQAYQDIARKLRLPGCEDSDVNPCELVSKWLKEEDHSWLMILDNADNAELFFSSAESDAPPATPIQTQRSLSDYLPSVLSLQKSLLVTTRSRTLVQDLIDTESCIEVPPFSIREAESLLRLNAEDAVNRCKLDIIRRLLDVLGYSPLAITQAAAFITHNRMSVQGYLADLEKNNQNLTDHLSQELQDPRRPHGFPNSIFRTWKLSFDQILIQEPQTAKLLSLIAMLDPQRIPERLLQPLFDIDVDFRMAISTLTGYALISQDSGRETYTIHPLVQASVHYWLEQRDEKADYASRALQLLAKEFPSGEHEHKKRCESLLAHAQAVLCYDCVSEDNLRNRGALLYNVGWFNSQQGRYTSAYREASEAYKINQEQLGEDATTTLRGLSLLASVLQDQGRYEVAEEMNRRALKGYEKVLGVEHPDTLTSVNNLASVLWCQGKYEAAEEMNRRALEGRGKVLGVEHPSTLTSVSLRALVLQDQGNYKAAEEMDRRVLAGYEKVLGVEHPDTLTSVSNLASVLQYQGKYEVAEEMNRRALEGRGKVLGVEHPSTLTSVSNLASVLQYQGKYEAAEKMNRRALEGYEKVLGVEHPDTLASVSNLASVLQDQGKYEAAEEMNRRALEGRGKVLGVEHPDTLTSVSNLASVLHYQGKYEAAEEMNRQALEGRGKVLGVEHPSTLASVSNLASVLQGQGRYEAAEEMNRRALEGYEKVLGVEHPSTLTSVSYLASVLQGQGKYEAAEEMNRRALEGREKVLGVEHPDTLTSVSNLASVLQGQGKYEATEEMNRRALEGRGKVLGVEHPSTLASVSNLASVLQYQGKYEAAEEMNRRALEGRGKVLGVEHPSTLTSVSNLASVLQYQGKYEAAEEMNRRALEGRGKVLGVEHPDTLTSVSNLASVLQDQGKCEAAEEMNRRALEGYEKVLGVEHPDTLTSVSNLASVLWCQGKYEAAEEMNRRALEGREKVLGVEHPDTLTSVSNLASVLQGQGKYEAAEEMNRRALEGREMVLGIEHPSTLTSVSNLASALRDQEKYEAAEEMNQRALAGREKMLRVEHPSTLASVNNLASVLRDQGKYEAYEGISRRVSKINPSILEDSDESNSSETASITSSTWSESSKSSVSTYASASDTLVAALDEFMAFFMSDEGLANLFAEAFIKHDRDRVSRNGARLLKWLGRRLVVAAKTPVEKETAKFFLSRRHDRAIIDKIAQGIMTKSSKEEGQEQMEEELRQRKAIKQERLEVYLQEQKEVPPLNLKPEETGALTNKPVYNHGTALGKALNDGGSDASSDSEDEEKDRQQTIPSNIEVVKLFLKSSDAFARFKEEVEDFVGPFRSEAMWTKTLWNRGERVRFEHSSNMSRLTKIDQLKLATEEKLGMPILWWPLKQPRKHLPSSKVRIIWICEHGDETYVDVSCAKARRYRRMCDTEKPVNVTAGEPPILPTHDASLAGSSGTRGLKSSTSALIDKMTGTFRRRYTKKDNAGPPSRGSEQNATIIPDAIPTLKHIHWCVDSAPRRTFLHHICIEQKKGKDFINELCKSYKKLRGWRWYLSMTTCTEIKLVKLSRVYNDEEAVICTCKGDVLPNLGNQREYIYNIDPPDLEKEIHILRAERALIDYYHGYNSCHATDHISRLIVGIPHRVTGTKLGLKGYGIWARQGWTLARLATFALITQGWAVVFVAFWLWYHPGDLQNAFSPAYYSLGLVTVFIAVPDVLFT